MPEQYVVRPVGHVRCTRAKPIDDDWDSVQAVIELDETKFDAEALLGLDSFSHVEVVYLFHKVKEKNINLGARHPRGRTDWPKIGIFAQRGKDRPNRIGVTVCSLVSVNGTRLTLRGLDAIDGSPVLDLKPVMSGFQPRGDFFEPEWAGELMKDYW